MPLLEVNLIQSLGYRFWDEQNRKIIRSRDVIFNGQVLYKDRLQKISENTGSEMKEPALVNLRDIPVHELHNTPTIVESMAPQESRQGTDTVTDENVAPDVNPQTPVAGLRRSSRISRPVQRFSPSLNYILLTDRGELECYEEATQVDESIKWELAMKDEMDSLLSNQAWKLVKLSEGKKAL